MADSFDDEEDDFNVAPPVAVAPLPQVEVPQVPAVEVPTPQPVAAAQQPVTSVGEPPGQSQEPFDRSAVDAVLAERQELINTPYQPVHHRAAVDPREERALQLQSQRMEEESRRERASQLKQRERWLKAQGVEFELQPDGSEQMATHGPGGAPRFKPAVVKPFEWEGKNPMRVERDAWGNEVRVNLLEVGEPGKDYKRDDKSGEYFVDTAEGRQWLGKRDDAFLQQRQYAQIREKALADHSLQATELSATKMQMRELKADYGSAWSFEQPAEELQKAVNDAMNARRDADDPGLFSFLPGGQVRRERRVSMAQENLNEAEYALEAQQKKSEYDRLAATAGELEKQMLQKRQQAAMMSHNMTTMKHGGRPLFAADPRDDDPERAAERQAWMEQSGVGGSRVMAPSQYPASMLEPSEDPAGKPRVRHDALLERAQAMADVTGKTVSEMYPVATAEAKRLGLDVPAEPEGHPLYRVKKDGSIYWDQNDPLGGMSQAVRDGVVPMAKGLAMIRQAVNGDKRSDNGTGKAVDFAARAAITTSNAVNRSLAGLSRFLGADELADWFAENQRIGEDDLTRKAGVTNRALDDTTAAKGAEVLGNVAGFAPAMAATGPMGAVAAAGRGLFVATRLATLAPKLVGILPMAVQGASDAYESAWQGAKKEGKDDTAAANAGNQAMINTLPALALYAGAGAMTEKILKPLTRVLPILETPWKRFAAATAIDAPLNVAASVAVRTAMGEGPMTMQDIATDIAFSLIAGGHAHEAAKYLPTANAMADGSHPEVTLLRSIASDKSASQEHRAQAANQAEQLQRGAQMFLNEFGKQPGAAPIEHLDAMNTLRDLDAIDDSAPARDARIAALDRANTALNRMVTAKPAVTGDLVRSLANPESIPLIARMVQHGPADANGAALVAIGKRAIENGTISPSQLVELRSKMGDIPTAEHDFVLNHAIGASILGDTYPLIARGNALDAESLGYLQTLQEAGIVRVDPETGKVRLSGEYQFLLPKSLRERLARDPGDLIDASNGNDLSGVSRLIREGHELGITQPEESTSLPAATGDQMVTPDPAPVPAEGIPSPEGEAVGSVPVMITRAMEQQLRERGLSQEQIDKLRPAEAHEILSRQVESDQSVAGEPTSTPENLKGEKINRVWTAFSQESGSLGVPRAEMPQIKAKARGALTQFLKARGIAGTMEEVLPGELKPTQAEYSQGKVDKAKQHIGGDRALLVSAEGHVVDGHHQWMAKLQGRPNQPIRVLRLNAPITEILREVSEFPSTEYSGGAKATDPALTHRVEGDEHADAFANVVRVKSAKESARVIAEADAEAARLRQSPEGAEQLRQDLEERQFMSDENAARAEMEAELSYAERDLGGTELLDAIESAGGLPSRGHTGYDDYRGELDSLHENTRGAKAGGLKGQFSGNLFRKDAPPIDQLVQRLREAGFDVEAPNDVFDLLDRRQRSGEPIYGQARSGQDDLAFEGFASYSRSSGMPKKSLPKREVEDVVKRLSRKWVNKPEIEVIDGYDSLPEGVRDQYRSEGVEAFYKDGKVTVIAEKLGAHQDAARVILHEVVGHHGIESVVGKEEMNRAMDYVALKHGKEVSEIAKARDLNLMNPEQRRVAVKEFIAKQAEPGRIKALAHAIKSLLQKVIPGLKFDDDYVRQLIQSSRRFLEGKEAGAGPTEATGQTFFAKAAVGMKLRDVGPDFVRDDIAPRLMDVKGSPSEIAVRAAGEFQQWPQRIRAADGSSILLHNAEGGSLGARVRHLLFDHSLNRINPEKARWLPMVPETLENAAVRLIDAESKNRIYVREYSSGQKHMVIVKPDGTVVEQKPFSGKLITQFPEGERSRQAHMEIDWVRPDKKTDSGRSQGNPGPAPTGSTHPDARQSEFRSQNNRREGGRQQDSNQSGKPLFSKMGKDTRDATEKPTGALGAPSRMKSPAEASETYSDQASQMSNDQLVRRGRRAPARQSVSQSSRTAQGQADESALKPPLEPLEDQTSQLKTTLPSEKNQPNSSNARGLSGETLFSKTEKAISEIPEKPLSDEEKYLHGPKVEQGLKGLRRIYDGTADVLERTPGLEKLGKAVRLHVDRQREMQGKASVLYYDLRKKEGGKLFDKAEKEVEDYYKLADGDPAAAKQKEAMMTPEGKEHLNVWRGITRRFADYAERRNVQVQQSDGTWRPIGRIEDYHPRMVTRKFRDAITDPDGHPKELEELSQMMMGWSKEETAKAWAERPWARKEDGSVEGVPVLKTVKDVQDYFKQVGFTETLKTDHFGAIEKARELELPNKLYDYSFDARRRYILTASERLAQIEAYGQKGKDPDLFEITMKSVHDRGTQEYINAVSKRVYNETEQTSVHRVMSIMNSVVTGTMLSNPVSVTLNLVSGLGYSASTMGIRNNLKTVMELRQYAKAARAAREKGIILEDLMELQHDADIVGSTAASRVNELTGKALKWSGFNAAENVVRTINYLAAKNYLRAALEIRLKNPTSTKAQINEAWFRRNGIDADKLYKENGEGRETDKFLRAAVNAAQGGYRIDQTPVYQNTAVGKFLFKYQKWGAQASRNFVKNVVEPMSGKSGPREFKPLFRYLAATAMTGAVLTAFKEAIFGTADHEASFEEIARTWDKDEVRALSLTLSKFSSAMITSGAFGMLGNYAQMASDVAERSRFKNPLDPPALSPMKGTWDMVLRLIEQKKLTPKDLDDYLRSQLSTYRTTKAAIGKIGGLPLERQRQEMSWLRGVTRRFADEVGIQASRTSLGRVAKTQDSPLMRDIHDALSSGDVQSAKEKIADYLSFAPVGPAREARRKSLQSSIRARQPIRVGAAGEARRELFLKWAKERLSQEDLKRVHDIDAVYRQTARRAGVFNARPVTDRQRRDLAQKLSGSGNTR